MELSIKTRYVLILQIASNLVKGDLKLETTKQVVELYIYNRHNLYNLILSTSFLFCLQIITCGINWYANM